MNNLNKSRSLQLVAKDKTLKVKGTSLYNCIKKIDQNLVN